MTYQPESKIMLGKATDDTAMELWMAKCCQFQTIERSHKKECDK